MKLGLGLSYGLGAREKLANDFNISNGSALCNDGLKPEIPGLVIHSLY